MLLLVMNQKRMERLEKDKLTLGTDASVAAGPVGRTASADTDISMRAEIVSYSRSHGVLPVLHSMALFWGATTQRIESFMGGEKVSHPSVTPSRRAECRLGVGEVRRSPPFLGSDFRKLHVLHLNLFPSFHGPNKSPG